MKQNEVLFLLGSICILVFAWIAFSLVHSSLTSTLSSDTLQVIQPIQPTFDQETIDAMGRKTQVQPVVVLQPQTPTNIVITTAPTQAPAITKSTVATTGGKLQ